MTSTNPDTLKTAIPGSLWMYRGRQEIFRHTTLDKHYTPARIVQKETGPGKSMVGALACDSCCVCMVLGTFQYRDYPNYRGVLFLYDTEILSSTTGFFFTQFEAFHSLP